jgi:hypothetical protein
MTRIAERLKTSDSIREHVPNLLVERFDITCDKLYQDEDELECSLYQGTITAEPRPLSFLTAKSAWFASARGKTVTIGRMLSS